MAPALGFTTQVIRQAKWYKRVADFALSAIEINRQNSKLHLNHFYLAKVKSYLERFDLSVHSGTAGIFQPHETFTKANLAVLTAEVDVCRFLGARQLVFHLGDGRVSAENKRRLRDVVSYAEDCAVELLYESNSILVADYACDILESFPSLGYVLDLGHLNNGRGCGKLGCDLEEFVGRVRSRVVYVHASNNSGLVDEHNGLDDGTLDWRAVLDMLDLERVAKIIIEVRDSRLVESSAQQLRRHLGHAAAPLIAAGPFDDRDPAHVTALLQ